MPLKASRRALAATFNRALRAESLLAADLGSIAGMGGGDTFFSRHDEEERDKRDDEDDGPSLVRGSGAGRRPEVGQNLSNYHAFAAFQSPPRLISLYL